MLVFFCAYVLYERWWSKGIVVMIVVNVDYPGGFVCINQCSVVQWLKDGKRRKLIRRISHRQGAILCVCVKFMSNVVVDNGQLENGQRHGV